ncbi:hypothetical protein ACHAW6_005710 [Cyclotella cf. meneghiniana]
MSSVDLVLSPWTTAGQICMYMRLAWNLTGR